MNPLATQDGSVALVLILAPLIAALIAAQLVWRSGRKKKILETWAAANGVRLLDYEERRLARGPFFFSTAKGQVVYRIAVQHPDGQTATGWLRCGSWAFGLLSDTVTVRWDQPKPEPPGFPVIMNAKTEEQPPAQA